MIDDENINESMINESIDILDENEFVHYTNGEFKTCDCGERLKGTEQSDGIYTFCPRCDLDERDRDDYN